jgi:hypothetical protein
MESPKRDHQAALKQLMHYVLATASYGLQYRLGEGSLKLIRYSDNDLARDVDDRRSTTGAIFFLGQSPISWLSQKQKAVAKSSCEAEYMASAAAAAHACSTGDNSDG